jgi:hypothetical protein
MSKLTSIREDVLDVFGVQVRKLEAFLDEQIRRLEWTAPSEQIVSFYTPFADLASPSWLIEMQTYLVLSGGLGSSPYVWSHLRAHLIQNTLHPNAIAMRLLKATDP